MDIDGSAGSDKFVEAGFKDYITFKKEINAVATALLKNFKDEKLFKEFEEKLNKISVGFCISDIHMLFTILGNPDDMRTDIKAGKFDNDKFRIVLQKLKEAKTFCPVWVDPGPDVNPLTATSGLGPGMTASDSSSSSSSGKKKKGEPVDSVDDSILAEKIIINMDYSKVNITNDKLKKIYIYDGNWCEAIKSNLKELILLLQITTSKINAGLPNYSKVALMIKLNINKLFVKLNTCSDKYEPPNALSGPGKIEGPSSSPPPPSSPDANLSGYNRITKKYEKIIDNNSGKPFVPVYYHWYDNISHETISRFKIRSNGRSKHFPGDLYVVVFGHINMKSQNMLMDFQMIGK